MRKSETLDPMNPSVSEADRKFIQVDENYHSTTGPIHTSFSDTYLPLESEVLQAAQEATGLPGPVDSWSGNHIGFGYHLTAISRVGATKGKRSYAARDYLEPIQHRSNLNLVCESTVSKVLLEGTPKAASGVQFLHGGTSYTVKAKKEVIICCGTYQSPQILELSGIGDPHVLKKAGVDCQVSSPGVGSNLQDHVMSFTGYELKDGITSGDVIFDPDVMAEAQKTYAETQGGPLTSLLTSIGFFPFRIFATDDEVTKIITPIRETRDKLETSDFLKKQLDGVIRHLEDDKAANLHFGFVPLSAGWDTAIQDQSTLIKPPQPGAKHQIALSVNLQFPASRGSVHIKGSGKLAQIEATSAVHSRH